MFFGDKQENISQKDDEAIIKTHFDLVKFINLSIKIRN